MTSRSKRPDDERPIRETYEEFDVDGTTVAMITDPENERAWLQSDVVRDVER